MAKRKINLITADKKMEVIKKWQKGMSVKELSKEYEVGQSTIYRWVREYNMYKDETSNRNIDTYKHEGKIAELERKIGQLTMENDLLKKKEKKMKERIQLMKEIGEI